MIDYFKLVKPGIILGNLFTVAAGFALGSVLNFNFLLFFITMIGMTLIMASACVFNNYIDRFHDEKMHRTKNRALVNGTIKINHAIIFATALGLTGHLLLLVYTNLLTFMLATTGFFVYVILYSFLKSKTVYATAIGSVAGAIPCVVGYCAASGHFDLAASLLFAMMVFWQMPHFFAIALFHLEDYCRADIPVLPASKGILKTKVQMLFYVILFLPTTLLLTYFGYTGAVFLYVIGFLGFAWLALSIQGFWCRENATWGKTNVSSVFSHYHGHLCDYTL